MLEEKARTPEIKRLESALTSVMAHDPNMTVQRLAVFLYIANHPDCSVKQVYTDLGLSQPGVYKHLTFLADKETYGQKRALGLVSVKEILDPRPVKVLSLTAKGRQFKNSLAGLISGD